MIPTADRLRELVSYDPETGVFTALVKRRGLNVGESIGTAHHSGYLICSIDGHRNLLMHRLAWLYMMGEMPVAQIDHRNGNKSDNRWENLRLATFGQNQMNKGGWNKHLKGVNAGKRGFTARIMACGRSYYLGHFKTAEAAHAAYQEAATRLHGDFARLA